MRNTRSSVRVRGLVVAAGFAVAMGASVASADEISFRTDRSGSDAYSMNGGGGEFDVDYLDADDGFGNSKLRTMDASLRIGDYFSSFCLEKGTDIQDDTTYEFTIDDGAITGGVGGGNPDPLSAESAWLYESFFFGTLDGYAYTDLGDGLTERGGHAAELQYAFWYLEEELSQAEMDVVDSGGNFANARGWMQDASDAIAGGWTNKFVKVLNLFTLDGQGNVVHAQSQMGYLVPLPPSAFMGLGLLLGLGAMRRSRRRRSAAV